MARHGGPWRLATVLGAMMDLFPAFGLIMSVAGIRVLWVDHHNDRYRLMMGETIYKLWKGALIASTGLVLVSTVMYMITTRVDF